MTLGKECRKGPGAAGRFQAQCELAVCALVAQRAKPIPGCFKHSIASGSKEMIILLYSALVQSYLECHRKFWALQFNKDVKVLSYIQRMETKLVQGLEEISYEEQLKTLHLSV